MNSDMTYVTSSSDSAATQGLAKRLARLLRGGEIIELTSDLGGGKTTFTQGLARGLGYTGEVTSPTFTLSRVYSLPSGLELHHYDLYRLGESGIVGQELAEDLGQPSNITVIEWAGIAESILPPDRLRIEFRVTGDTQRDLVLTGNGPVSDHLIQQLHTGAHS